MQLLLPCLDAFLGAVYEVLAIVAVYLPLVEGALFLTRAVAVLVASKSLFRE